MSVVTTVAIMVPLLHRLMAAGVDVAVKNDRLRVRPAAWITPTLRDELTARKPELLAVLSRLQGMRATVGQVAIPCAVVAAVGGPGRCFSCGDPLDYPHAYGRCTPCSLASDLFYLEVPDAAERWEVTHA